MKGSFSFMSLHQHFHTRIFYFFFEGILFFNLTMLSVTPRDSLVCIATGWTARVQFPAVQDFSLLRSLETESGAHPDSHSVDTGGSFPGG
jgi:hypothetical protein